MSDEIKVGDLVMVVRGAPCCGGTKKLGFTFNVIKVQMDRYQGLGVCSLCGTKFVPRILAYINEDLGCPLSCLKKINPPALPEESENKRELVA